MAINTVQLGASVMELADRLVEMFQDENVTLGITGIVVELHHNDLNQTAIVSQCTDLRGWVQEGFFKAAMDGTRGRLINRPPTKS